MITPEATYEEVLATVYAGVADVAADLGVEAADAPDDVFHDVLVSVLYDAAPAVGAEVWRTQVGGPPPRELARHWAGR